MRPPNQALIAGNVNAVSTTDIDLNVVAYQLFLPDSEKIPELLEWDDVNVKTMMVMTLTIIKLMKPPFQHLYGMLQR